MTDYFKYTTRKLTEEESHELINRLFDENARLKVESDRRRDNFNEMCDKYRELEKKHEDLRKRQNACADTWVKYEDRIDTLNGTLEAKNEEIRRLREKVANQKTQLIETQQALTDRNMEVEALKKDVTGLRIKVHDLERDKEMSDRNNEDLLAKLNRYDECYNELKEINKELQEDYDSLKLTYYGLMKRNPGYFTPPTQPLYIENLNVTYYANGPIWTNEEDEDDIPGSVE